MKKNVKGTCHFSVSVARPLQTSKRPSHNDSIFYDYEKVLEKDRDFIYM